MDQCACAFVASLISTSTLCDTSHFLACNATNANATIKHRPIRLCLIQPFTSSSTFCLSRRPLSRSWAHGVEGLGVSVPVSSPGLRMSSGSDAISTTEVFLKQVREIANRIAVTRKLVVTSVEWMPKQLKLMVYVNKIEEEQGQDQEHDDDHDSEHIMNGDDDSDEKNDGDEDDEFLEDEEKDQWDDDDDENENDDDADASDLNEDDFDNDFVEEEGDARRGPSIDDLDFLTQQLNLILDPDDSLAKAAVATAAANQLGILDDSEDLDNQDLTKDMQPAVQLKNKAKKNQKRDKEARVIEPERRPGKVIEPLFVLETPLKAPTRLPYSLEVSTPGVSNVLTQDFEFVTFKSFPVVVNLAEEWKNKSRFEGTLVGRDKEFVRINIKGRITKIPRKMVVKVELGDFVELEYDE